jgi:NAD(P)H dehydrogenase (quinone)
MPAKIAVIYYSATGNVHGLANAIVEGAEAAGAEVRLRRAAENAPAEAVASNPAWQQHREDTKDIPEATADDILWADGVVFGTPTRYGNVSAQLKGFIDTLGPQWAQGQLANKVYSGFTSASTSHGGHESTLLALYNTVHHFGGIVVAPGYTDPIQFAAGTPYGATHISAQGESPLGDVQKASARFQGGRVAKVAAVLAGADLSV